eukprot:gene2733-2910_t
MSTAQRELEELRRAREAARLQAEEERKIEEEKQKERDKKQAFLNRAAAFQQKKGPSDDEVRQQVTKNSQKQNLSRKLNRLLKEEPGHNPLALELNLKGKASNSKGEYVGNASDWEYVEDPGQRPYYWNRVTHETTYDPPDETGRPKPPPPPPPRMMLPGMQPPPPPRPPVVIEEVTEEANEVTEDDTELEEPIPVPQKKSPWVYVVINEPNPYYWNPETNETSFQEPTGYEGAIFGQTDPQTSEQIHEEEHEGIESSQIIWQEQINEAGELIYVSAEDGSVLTERPEGQLVVVLLDEEGNEVHWQEYSEDGVNIQYIHAPSGEILNERPEGGTTLILQPVSN